MRARAGRAGPEVEGIGGRFAGAQQPAQRLREAVGSGARLRRAALAGRNNVELVFTPTYASFLNRIECHFWAIGEFVVNNADYPNWDAMKKAMADHITYRNGPHRDQRLLKAERRLLIAA